MRNNMLRATRLRCGKWNMRLTPIGNETEQRREAYDHSGITRTIHTLGTPKFQTEKMRITILGLATNVSLAALKLMAGIYTGSNALISDGVHSVADAASDVVTIGSIHLSAKEPDSTHPFGWGSYESVGSFALGLSLIGAGSLSGFSSAQGLLVGVASAATTTTTTTTTTMPTDVLFGDLAIPAFCVATFSVIVKEALFRKTFALGTKANSPVLIASAYHHRADSLSTVVAGAGILLSRFVNPLFDPIGGLVVSGMVIKAGMEVTMDAISDLTGRQKSDHRELVRKIRDLVVDKNEILDAHDIRVRRLGPSLVVDLHVVVDPLLSVTAGYNAGQRLRRKVLQHFDVVDVFVHVDVGKHAFKRTREFETDGPDSVVFPPAQEIEKQVREVVAQLQHPLLDGVAHSTSHYVLEKNKPQLILEVNLITKSGAGDEKLKELYEVGDVVRAALFRRFNNLKSVDLHVQLPDETGRVRERSRYFGGG